MDFKKYSIIQCNGQRTYQPAAFSTTPPPPRGSEIFVGNLPRDLFEDDLIPIFEQAGPIYKFRLMMDFSGETRGFGFVQYCSIEEANRAVLRFDRGVIKSKTRTSRMSVYISLDNVKLYFGNIPRTKTGEEVRADLAEYVDGVVKVIVYEEREAPYRNRGFAFVEFETHATAAIARRKLLSRVIDLWGNFRGFLEKLYVDWAEPEPIVNPIVLTQVKILYFKNVPFSWSSGRFREFTLKTLRNQRIVRIYKKDNYAFVHFYNRTEAEKALNMLQKMAAFLIYSGKQIQVEWARPMSYSKKFRAHQPPNNFCTSVPPRLRKLIRESKKNHGFLDSIPISNNGSSSGSDISEDTENNNNEMEDVRIHFKQLSLGIFDF